MLKKTSNHFRDWLYLSNRSNTTTSSMEPISTTTKISPFEQVSAGRHFSGKPIYFCNTLYLFTSTRVWKYRPDRMCCSKICYCGSLICYNVVPIHKYSYRASWKKFTRKFFFMWPNYNIFYQQYVNLFIIKIFIFFFALEVLLCDTGHQN